MRKVVVIVLALIFLLSFGGSAFASTKLDNQIDKLLGIRYKYGGTTTKGFDCSGFTSYVFDKLGIELPHASRSQATLGSKVAKSELRPGDLVFFNTNGKSISHVGIYVGNNKFAHASSTGVRFTSLNDKYYAKRYVTARRIMSNRTYELLAAEPDSTPDKAATVAAAKPAGAAEQEQALVKQTLDEPEGEDAPDDGSDAAN